MPSAAAAVGVAHHPAGQYVHIRIPERIVHAKGGGAFGEFVVTGDVSQYTKAVLFQPGARTSTLERNSSVAGEQGSPDTWRGVRGFSVKFYATEGIYDTVGNNTPVFFLRDGIKFPDFIHSKKRLPGSGLCDAVFDFELTDEQMTQIATLEDGNSQFFDHRDPAMVSWLGGRHD